MTTTPLTRLLSAILGRLRHERGQAMIEFAIVLPVLVLITVGIFTLGRYMDYATQETQMAEGAARSAAVNFDPPGTQTIQAYVQAQATVGLQTISSDVTSPATVYLYYPTSTCSSGVAGSVGCSLRACVIATVQLLPMLGGFSTQITESATMRIEQAATTWTPNSPPAGSACPTS